MDLSQWKYGYEINISINFFLLFIFQFIYYIFNQADSQEFFFSFRKILLLFLLFQFWTYQNYFSICTWKKTMPLLSIECRVFSVISFTWQRCYCNWCSERKNAKENSILLLKIIIILEIHAVWMNDNMKNNVHSTCKN